MNYYRIFLCNIWGIFFLISPTTHAQTKDITNIDHQDPSFRYGQLDNGFTYYIKHVGDSPKKLNMHFYVKVGNYHQQKDQLEFAHAIEHLAFKCAEHFPVNVVDDTELFSELGMTNHDIGGSTQSLHTEYYFNVPSDSEKAINTGFCWFHDISNLQLTDGKINNEKGPLRQEVVLRQGNNLSDFFLKKHLVSQLFPCKLDFSNFFEHNRSFSPASLRESYKEWYHPDRMAVAIVGDISDIDELERKVKTRFSDIKGHTPLKSFTDCRWRYLEGPDRFAVMERGPGESPLEDEYVEIHLYIRDGNTLAQRENWEGVQRAVIWEMLGKLIDFRFKDAGMEYNATFSSYGTVPNKGFPVYRLKITERKGKGQKAVEKTIGILRTIKNFGFKPQEWEQVKKQQLAAIKRTDTANADYWLEQIKDHYVYGETLYKNESIDLYRWLSALSLKEFNALSRQYVSDRPNDIGVITPKGKSYTEAEVRGWIDRALMKEPMPYILPDVPGQLLGTQEISALNKVGFKDKGQTEFGVRELVLENGVKVVLDTSNKNSSRLYLHGFSPKGASCFPKEDYFSAINAPSIVKNAGVGNLDKFALERFLAKTSFRQGVNPYIKYAETGITGNAEAHDIEKLLQLVYLYFSKPRKDKLAFEDWKLEEIERCLDPTYSLIQEDFDVATRQVLGDNTIAPQGTIRFHGIPKTDLDRTYTIYQQLYGSAKDFTFLISGDFSVETVLPLIQRYLGNLPNRVGSASHNLEGDKQKEMMRGLLYTEFTVQEIGGTYDMKSVLYTLRFPVKVNDPLDWKEHLKMEALGILMNSKIRELRYSEEAALYNSIAWSYFNRDLSYYYFDLRVDCVPEELEHLRELCKQMVMDVKRGSFGLMRFNEVMNSQIIPKYSAKQESNFAKRQKLHNHYLYKEPWVAPYEIEQYIKSLTLKDFQQTAKKYLRDENLVEFVMRDGNKYP